MSSEQEYLFESAMSEKTEIPAILAENKHYLNLPDSNSSNYDNQQLIFDLTSLSTQSSFISLSESVIEIPLQITLKGTENLEGNLKNVLALKGSSSVLVNSCQCMIDNQTIVNFCDRAEIPAVFKQLTTFSNDYENVMSNTDMLKKDDGKITYSTSLGETLTSSAVASKASLVDTYADSDFQKQTNILTAEKDHFIQTDKLCTWNYVCRIKLRDLCDGIFEKINLARGVYLRLSLQMHQCVTSFKLNAGAVTSFSAVSTHNVCPYYLSQAVYNTGTHKLSAATGDNTITIRSAISKTIDSVSMNPLLTSCRFRAVAYTPVLEMERKLLSRSPIDIDYYQRYIHQHSVAANTQFQYQISSSSSRPSHLLIHTSLSNNMSDDITSDAFGGTKQKVQISQSCFSCSPITTKAYSSLTNFNILIGGNPLFKRGNVSSDYEMFMDNFASLAALNGQRDVTQCSGLLNKEDYNSKYGYVLIDLKKYGSPAEWQSPKDISIIGTNNSPNKVNYIFQLFEMKDLKMDMATGKILL